MSTPIGVTVQEGVSTGLTPFQEVAKYNVGLIMERERGIPNVPVKVLSLQDDRKRFGGLNSAMFGPYVARHLFKNAQNYGAVVYGVRVLDTDNSDTASGLFTDGAGSPTTIFTAYAGQSGYKDPGTWANSTSYSAGEGLKVRGFPIGHTNGIVDKYLFEVFYKNKLVESWEAVTWAELIASVNDRSAFVYLEAGDLTKDITDIQQVHLSGGTYAAPVESDFYPVPDETSPTGLAIFDNVDVQIIICAEHHTVDMATQGRDYANGHQNRPIYVYNLPYFSTSTEVETFAAALQTDNTDCSAGYNFWVKTSDEAGGFVWTPSVGVIVGAGYVRVPGLNRDFIHYPPGGVESAFVDVVDINPNNLTEALMTQWVKRYSTNVAVYKQGKGFFLFTSRTNSTNSLYQSVHIRRLTSYYKRTLELNLLWAVQKPVTPQLKREMYVSIYQYFLGEYGRGALEGSIPFDQACVINVEQDTQDRKILKVIIDVILTECAESIRIELNRNDNSLIVNA
jgi:hypothetical protein